MDDFLSIFDAVQSGRGTWSPQAGYTGGQINSRNAGWRPRNRTGDAEIRRNYELLTARARWLGRNNPWCVGAAESIVNNIIGEGVATRSCVRDGDGNLMRDWNRASNEAYSRWMEQADAAGRMHWNMMTRTNLFQTIESGESLLVETAVNNPNRIAPIAFELIEPDQIDVTKDRPASGNQNKIVRGIEFDKSGRRVAYHLWTQHPGDVYAGGEYESERVEAWRVIHLFKAKRPSQTRGVSWFAPIVTALWNSYEYMQHEIEAAKVASFFVYMLKREYGQDSRLGFVDADGNEAPTDEFGNAQAPLGPGIGLYGGPKDGLEIVQSNRPNGNAVPWLKFMLQMMGQGVGLSFQRFTGDFSQTTFSSARAADLQDRKGFIPAQFWHAWYVDMEVRKRVTRQLIASGELIVPSGGVARFDRNQSRWLACKARPPGWGYIDPEKQVAASLAAIGGGLSTWEKELSERGLDRDEVFEELAEEFKQLDELGLKDVLTNLLAKAQKPAPAGGSGDQQQKQDPQNADAQWREEEDDDV